jgi:hypothetical protein
MPFSEFSTMKLGKFVADGIEAARGIALLNFEPLQFRLCGRQILRGKSRQHGSRIADGVMQPTVRGESVPEFEPFLVDGPVRFRAHMTIIPFGRADMPRRLK